MATHTANPLYRSQEGYEKIMAHYDLLLSQWPIEYESHLISTQHGEAHVIVSGPEGATPLVLLHGATIHSGMWLPNIAALSRDYRTFCVDIIGEGGKSAPIRLQRKGPEHADWLCEVLDGLEIKTAHIAGVSLGGWFALQMAIHAPERVQSVITISSPAFVHMSWGFVLRGIPAALFPTRRTVASLVHHISPPTVPPDPEFIDAMWMFFQHQKPNMEQPTIISDDLLRRISAPTLVIVGEYETVGNPQRMVERARRLIKNVQAEIVPDAGHGVSSDQPERVNALILQFLAEHSQASET